MQSPTNSEEENVFTQGAELYLGERERKYKEELQLYKEELRVHKVFLWVAVIFCACCFLLCWYGVHTFVQSNDRINYFIAHETILNERRDKREMIKAEQDSILTIKNLEKAKRDSIAWVRHSKQMDRYDALPDYKNER